MQQPAFEAQCLTKGRALAAQPPEIRGMIRIPAHGAVGCREDADGLEVADRFDVYPGAAGKLAEAVGAAVDRRDDGEVQISLPSGRSVASRSRASPR